MYMLQLYGIAECRQPHLYLQLIFFFRGFSMADHFITQDIEIWRCKFLFGPMSEEYEMNWCQNSKGNMVYMSAVHLRAFGIDAGFIERDMQKITSTTICLTIVEIEQRRRHMAAEYAQHLPYLPVVYMLGRCMESLYQHTGGNNLLFA